jgi:hypothetical protein
MDFKFSLGEVVKDRITGYDGVVMGITAYLTGCIQYGVLNQKLDKDGEIKEWRWFDQTRLVTTKKTVTKEAGLGGPMPTAPSN